MVDVTYEVGTKGKKAVPDCAELCKGNRPRGGCLSARTPPTAREGQVPPCPTAYSASSAPAI